MATRIREKANARKAGADKRPRAIARYVRISPRKVKIVLDLPGGDAHIARAILSFTPKAAAPVALKVLESAVANAENNLDLTQDTLYVAECYANQGPTLKRFRPRAHGRAARILKRTSHITVVLDTVK